jgi:glycosyltransferase involved in cell wall biosynthesis
MKSIGYVLAEFPVLSETFVGNEMRTMQVLQHQVIPIACSRPKGPTQPDDQLLAQSTHYLTDVNRLALLRLLMRHPIGCCKAAYLALQQRGIRPRSALLMAAKIATVASTQHCQHLHAHFALQSATGALLAARWLGITVSFVGHGYDVYATPADLAMKLEQADFAVAVCYQMQLDFLQLAPAAKVALVPCGIALDKFQFSNSPSSSKRLLFIGRLTEKKGIINILNALAALPESERPGLDLVGDGELKTAIASQITQLNLDRYVRLLGSQNSDWIRQHATDYLALVAPFQIAANGDRDTGPLVLKEAMALGLPVICSRLMGCVEIVDHTSGYLVPSGDPVRLSAAIRQVLQLSAAERSALIYRARSRVEQRFNVVALCRLLSQQIEAAK